MQTEQALARRRRYMPAGVDEYLQREGLTDEEWERIFDLRYCTILVPKKGDGNSSDDTGNDSDPGQHTASPFPDEQHTESLIQQLQVEPHQSLDNLAPPTPTTPPPPASILTKHRSNSLMLPPTPTAPNPKRRRLIDPSLEIDEQPAFISEDSSDDDAMGHEHGQSELGGVSEDEGPMSSNDPMFGFLRQPRRSRRESTSSVTNHSPPSTTTNTTTAKKPFSPRSFFSKFWRSNSPDHEGMDLVEPDMEFIDEDDTRPLSPKAKIEVLIDRTPVKNQKTPSAHVELPSRQTPSDAMEVDRLDNDASDNDMQADTPPLLLDSTPGTLSLQVAVSVKSAAADSRDSGADKDKDSEHLASNIADHNNVINPSATATATTITTTTTTTQWPLPSPTHQLLRERRPRANTDFSHLAWMTSPSLGARSRSSSRTLLKPRHFTPPHQPLTHPAFGQREPFSLPDQPNLLRKTAATTGSEKRIHNYGRRSSLSSDISSSTYASTTISSLLLPRVPLMASLGSQRATSSSDDWTNHHWNHLEVLYMQMNGDKLSEDNLFVVVDKFLEEDARQSGQPNRWSPNMIRRRCLALHRIRHSDKRRGTVSTRPWEQMQDGTKIPTSEYTREEEEKGEEETKSSLNPTAKRLPLTPFTPLAGPKPVSAPNPEALRDLLHPKGSTSSSTRLNRRRARESARPYPSTASFQRTASSVSDAGPTADSGALPTTSTSSSSSSSNESTQAALNPSSDAPSIDPANHGSSPSMASLLAIGLKSVRQLLPFWREVESGQGTIKELVAVPLVPQRKVKNVVDAFETALDEASVENDASSVVASGGGGHGGGGGELSQGQRRMSSVSMASSSRRSSASGVAESVAEMIARGHAARMRSSVASSPSNSSSNGSSFATLVTPSTSARSTEV
ncbi:hypothetical protein DFQ26_007896 [Actinomortierella ambigua]|nr:hypothetical protein DFQ26_007896 [Actinomortierella ambigua]